jgi:hypothetical protein
MEVKFVKLTKLYCTLVIIDIVQLRNGVLINSYIVFPREEYMYNLTLQIFVWLNDINIYKCLFYFSFSYLSHASQSKNVKVSPALN